MLSELSNFMLILEIGLEKTFEKQVLQNSKGNEAKPEESVNPTQNEGIFCNFQHFLDTGKFRKFVLGVYTLLSAFVR